MRDVNLIPVERRAHKRKMRRLSVWAAVCGVYISGVTFLLSVAYFSWGRDTGDMAERLRLTTDRIKEYHSTILDIRKEMAQAKTELYTIHTIQQQPNWSKLLWLIGEALGEEIVLNKCQLTTLVGDREDVVKRVHLEPTVSTLSSYFADRRYTLTLSGYSQTQSAVPLFVLRLERLGLFESVRLEKSRRQGFLDGLTTAFHIECIL